jgi:enoyl-CoA hydratase/carnithine racemase
MNARILPLETEKIVASVEDGVGWIMFNNPQARNAMSLAMWRGLGDAMMAFQADPRVRAVVMHGAGGKSFAAGADITEFNEQRANAEQKKAYAEIASRAHLGMTQLAKPLVAMIDGFCIGGGLAIALGADVRIASVGSQFGIPAAKLGLGYEYEGLATLARLVGPSVAKDMLFSARFLDTEEALRVGLINIAVAPAELDAHVRRYVTRIRNNAPLTVLAAKAAIRLFERYSIPADAQAAARVDAMVDQCFESEDYREGRTAFLEKRAPRFVGR